MKKTNTKLQLKTSTIRTLQGSELERVVGAGPTADCSAAGQCTSHPPQHPPGSGPHGPHGPHGQP